MQMTAEQMALILDNVQLYAERHQADKELRQIQEQLPGGEEFSLLAFTSFLGKGIFCTLTQVCRDFGYTFGELVSLESVLHLIAIDNRKFFIEQMNQCLQGYSKGLSCKVRGHRKDGSLIDVEVYGTRTKLYGKFVIIGALRLI
jgi:PAS domain S-box-containing protein